MKTFTLLALSLLAACQEPDPSADAAARPVDAERLEDAAAQSDPTSAAILEDAADEARAGNSAASAQGALATAGNASADRGVAANQPANRVTPGPPPKQAQPNLDGQVRPGPAVVPPNARD